jgi:hypothetical protein
VELILGVGPQVTVQFVTLNRRVLHRPRLHLVEQVGVSDLCVFAHACAPLHHTPKEHETDKDKDPEHDRLNGRIHQDPSFPGGEKSLASPPAPPTSFI